MKKMIVASTLALSFAISMVGVAPAQSGDLGRTINVLRTILGPGVAAPKAPSATDLVKDAVKKEVKNQVKDQITGQIKDQVTGQVKTPTTRLGGLRNVLAGTKEPTKEELKVENDRLKQQISVLRDIKTQELERRLTELHQRETEISTDLTHVTTKRADVQNQIKYYEAELNAINPDALKAFNVKNGITAPATTTTSVN